MVARGRTIERDEGNRGRFRSQSRNRKNVICFDCKKRGHVKKDCPCMKDKETKGEKIVASVAEDSNGSETVLSDCL